MQFPKILELLNEELKVRDTERELVICGGAALICLGWLSRKTRDVDVIIPELDPILIEAAEAVGKNEGLPPGWLNNGVAPFKNLLPKGWEVRSVGVFGGSHLSVKSLGRQDLIGTKLLGACDRGDDVSDLVRLPVTHEELEAAKAWVLNQDASDIWPKIVNECCMEILKQLEKRGG